MTAITEKATLGQKITFTATLKRMRYREARTWATCKCAETPGVVVGTRTLWEGTVYSEYIDEDDSKGWHSWFNFGKPVAAVLVAFALHRKPVLVPFDHITAA